MSEQNFKSLYDRLMDIENNRIPATEKIIDSLTRKFNSTNDNKTGSLLNSWIVSLKNLKNEASHIYNSLDLVAA